MVHLGVAFLAGLRALGRVGVGRASVVIYQAVGYKRLRDSTGSEYLHRMRVGQRTTRQNVAMAEADHLSQRHPELIWNVETVGASQQVRR